MSLMNPQRYTFCFSLGDILQNSVSDQTYEHITAGLTLTLCFRKRKYKLSQNEPSNLEFFLYLLDSLKQKNSQSHTTVRDRLIPVSVIYILDIQSM